MALTVSILGAPGSGKDTQSEFLVKGIGAICISPGKILRELEDQGALPESVIQDLKAGHLASDEFIGQQIALALKSISPNQPIVFDGTPRNIEQVAVLADILSTYGRSLDQIIYLEVSVESALQRLSARRVCERCGHSAMPTDQICAVCGGKLVRRDDDQPDVIRERFNVYQETIKPVLDLFRQKGTLVGINGEQAVEAVQRDILKVLKR